MHMPAYMSSCVFVQRAQSRPVHVAIGVLLFIEQSYPCINSYVCKVLSLIFVFSFVLGMCVVLEKQMFRYTHRIAKSNSLEV